MGKPGKKASNIFQNPGIKNNNGVKLPFIKGIGSPLKYGKSPMHFNATLKKAAAEGRLDDNPKFKAVVEKSPLKEIDKMGQRILNQVDKSEKAKSEGKDRKALRHGNRARRMNLRDLEKKSSPAKGYKSAAQRKAVHASKADGGAGHPDKKKSPAKKYGHKSPAKKYGKSPVKAHCYKK